MTGESVFAEIRALSARRRGRDLNALLGEPIAPPVQLESQ